MINTINPADYNDDVLSLKQAIKNYRDEYYTGLTDDEKKVIEAKVQAFIQTHPVKTPRDRMVLDDYVQRQYQKSGFKGQIDFMATLVSMRKSENADTDTNAAAAEPELDVSGPVLAAYSKNIVEKPKTTSKIITEFDGAQYMITETKNGLRMKIKVSDTFTDKDNRGSGPGRDNVNGMADIYESNLSAFSESIFSAVSV